MPLAFTSSSVRIALPSHLGVRRRGRDLISQGDHHAQSEANVLMDGPPGRTRGVERFNCPKSPAPVRHVQRIHGGHHRTHAHADDHASYTARVNPQIQRRKHMPQ
eukprot:5474956-Pleurochrysis_carterae.AAC.1